MPQPFHGRGSGSRGSDGSGGSAPKQGRPGGEGHERDKRVGRLSWWLFHGQAWGVGKGVVTKRGESERGTTKESREVILAREVAGCYRIGVAPPSVAPYWLYRCL